jgi:hypothetical protein
VWLQYDPRPDFDLSQLTYEEWLMYLFDRPVGDRVFWNEVDQYDNYHDLAEPATIVQHLQRTCLEHGAILRRYSREQVDQGLWWILSESLFDCGRTLFDCTVDFDLRRRCIESMYHVYADIVAKTDGDATETIYWMWWDFIGHACTSHELDRVTLDWQLTTSVIIQTLAKIVNLPNRRCQWAALHGLGHLDCHPKAREVVQRYLDAHGEELSADERKWVEACRECKVM